MYKEVKTPSGEISVDCIFDVENSRWIPNDPGNRDWAAYQAWLADGNTPEPADEV